jgi:hypothetical protein
LTIDHSKELKTLLDAAMNGDDVKGPWDATACVLACLVLAKGGDWQAKADEAASRRAEREASDKVGGAWGADEITELETATKQLFPLGTINRWDSIAAHMASAGKPRTANVLHDEVSLDVSRPPARSRTQFFPRHFWHLNTHNTNNTSYLLTCNPLLIFRYRITLYASLTLTGKSRPTTSEPSPHRSDTNMEFSASLPSGVSNFKR